MSKAKPRIAASKPIQKRRDPAARFRVAIVGAGRLGTALGIALDRAGFQVVAAVCRRHSHARVAARSIGSGVLALGMGRINSLPALDTIVISTPDDAIEATAERVAGVEQLRHLPVTLLHVSGALPSTILRPIAPPCWSVGSLHPLLAVSEPLSGAESLRSTYFGLEGEADALKVARQMVSRIGGRAVPVRTKQKALYHAAAVMAAGHAVSLFDLAVAMLVQCGPRREDAATMLNKLMQSAIRDLGDVDTGVALTGPFARGDRATIERNLAALDSAVLHEARDAYRILGLHAVRIAEGRGLAPAAAREIEKLLK